MEKKALDDFIADKKTQIDENMDLVIKRHEDEGKDLREQMERLKKRKWTKGKPPSRPK